MPSLDNTPPGLHYLASCRVLLSFTRKAGIGKNIPFPLGCQLLQRSPCSRERRACVERCSQDLAMESLPAWAPCTAAGARRRDYPPEGRSERFRDSPSGGSSLLSSPPAYRLPGCPSSASRRDEQCQGCSTALADQMQLYSIPATSCKLNKQPDCSEGHCRKSFPKPASLEVARCFCCPNRETLTEPNGTLLSISQQQSPLWKSQNY